MVDFVVDFLHRQGVRHVFGVGGANIEDLYDALHQAQDGPLGVVAKHEFSAATMADGYHRASQRVPVIASTSGAGAMNLVPGVAELRASFVPAVVLVGQPPAALDGRGSFQETSGLAGSIDAARLFGELGVHCARVDEPEAITDALPRAFAAATDPARPGPAVLLLPKDVQQAVLPTWAPPRPPAPAAPALTAAAERSRAAELLRDAVRRPGGVAVIAGEGVARVDARTELARLAAALPARVAVAADAKDVFDARDPRYLGIAGANGTDATQESLERAAAVVLAGTRLPQMTGAGLDDRLKAVPVICVDPRTPFLDAHGELVRLTGPLGAELELLADVVGPVGDGDGGGLDARVVPPAGGGDEWPAIGVAPRAEGEHPRPAAQVVSPAEGDDPRIATHVVPPTEDDHRRPTTHVAPPTEDDHPRIATHVAPPTEDDHPRPTTHVAPPTEDDHPRIATHVAPPPPPPPDTPLDMRTAALVISAALPEGSTVVADAGNAGAVATHHIDTPPGGRFVAALGMGGMGHSFGAGIGAAFATGRRACVVAGDGAFFMHGMEVHTAVEHRLPVTFVVLNNNAHGMCATRERLYFSGDYSYNLFRPARIGDGAAALFPDLPAVTVRTAGELAAALGRAHATAAPALICVDVDPSEMPPFRPFRQQPVPAGTGRPAPAREGAAPA
ncbi:acetolactate synthase [Streptomyces mobaraensis NBRC 13819 = DSM 40847]|uniref:Acetolactate synthase n=1 Tax=Streptomyces mobaraensis (strain ATCC 29032 / DSM 40847 / JCM 4168 / NBRC 13819 / NCIMB 11159 / IPCR 16-22) TaxID=1223523 RepID=M3BQB5_STRM1|nr:acetolactate synthase [Streptomyces mobaraensis NBRC 13819 = DSM 40847]